MKQFLLAIFSLMTILCSAQFAKPDELIQSLNNDQFKIHHEDKARFETKSTAMNKLMSALDDPNRNIMAHLILCHIYFKHASFAGPKIVSGEDANIYKYFLGEEKGEGLIISETRKGGNYKIYVEDHDRDRIKEFWKKKTGSH